MNRPTVLVVDDDPSMREYLASALRLGGFDVQTAADGLAALRRVEEQRPDAILLDLDLPIMNGFAVHAALQSEERTRRLPIVIATGTGWSGPIRVAATLLKPIPPEDLVRVMFDAIARGEQHVKPDGRDERRSCGCAQHIEPSCVRVMNPGTR
jgi:CheY-like chemotaxis protein